MYKKLAKIKYLPNNFKIIEDGDHVICISGKKIGLENLIIGMSNYKRHIIHTLSLQKKGKLPLKLLPSIMRPYPL